MHPDLATALFRIFQEALTNVARHAQATSVTVELLNENGQIQLIIADNGVGIDPEKLHDVSSFGLISMSERLYPWKGSVNLQGEPHKGTVVTVTVPYVTFAEGSAP